jgi:hypothetical protein
MNIQATQHYTNDWTAIDDDTYDGPGSAFGHGSTREEAISDLLEAMEERGLLD